MGIYTPAFDSTPNEPKVTLTIKLAPPIYANMFYNKHYWQLSYIISKHHGGYPGANWLSRKANNRQKTTQTQHLGGVDLYHKKITAFTTILLALHYPEEHVQHISDHTMTASWLAAS